MPLCYDDDDDEDEDGHDDDDDDDDEDDDDDDDYDNGDDDDNGDDEDDDDKSDVHTKNINEITSFLCRYFYIVVSLVWSRSYICNETTMQQSRRFLNSFQKLETCCRNEMFN